MHRTLSRIKHLIPLVRKHQASAERTPQATQPHRKQVRYSRGGKIRSALLLWLIGVPIPLILLIFLIKGCVT